MRGMIMYFENHTKLQSVSISSIVACNCSMSVLEITFLEIIYIVIIVKIITDCRTNEKHKI